MAKKDQQSSWNSKRFESPKKNDVREKQKINNILYTKINKIFFDCLLIYII